MKLYKNKIYLCFYKSKKNKVLSFCLWINNCAYTFRHIEKTIQKESAWNSKLMKERYIIIDTDCYIKDLKEDWEEKLLKQKVRSWDSLFFRYRCVKSTRHILNQLPTKWHYRFGDIFVNIYYKRRIK